jgi:guanylate kinase
VVESPALPGRMDGRSAVSGADAVTRKGVILVISGPSGVGKGTVIRHLLKACPHLRRSVSYTTRQPRQGEVHAKDYFFISPPEFERMMEAGEFLEWAVVHRHQSYGTACSQVVETIESGNDIVLEIDQQGAMAVRKQFPDAVLVFVAPPTWEELLRRLRGRHTENEQELSKRVESAFPEIGSLSKFDYVIVNVDSQDSAEVIAGILDAEHHRLSRTAWRELRDRLLAEGRAWQGAREP